MAEELSRQLEDILSTYCRESISDDASTLPNGQSHSPELNGLTRVDGKPEEGKVGGGVEKEQKKTQDKKKVKGLGEEWFTLFVRLSGESLFPVCWTKRLTLHNAHLRRLFFIFRDWCLVFGDW